MRRRFLFSFIFVILFSSVTLAGIYRSEHFIINSDLDPRFVKFIQANAEAYYENMVGRYFRTGGGKPLTIYYSKTQADTQKLFNERGIKSKVYYGQYFSNIPAIYTHQLMNDGGGTGWGTLFHEITHHFIDLNYRNPPAWFEEGLACILGETSRVIKGNLHMGLPNPWREKALRNMIENGFRIDVKRLTSLSAEDFHRNRNNYHPTRALFYWIYEIGRLSDYLQNVKQKGYSLSVLEQTVNLPSNRINAELLAFIKKNCYAGALLYDSYSSKNDVEKKGVLLKALELKPDYKRAQHELALCYYSDEDYKKCKEYLQKILNDPNGIEYRDAAELMGHCYYASKDYAQALDYYQKSLEYSDYYEDKYELYYWMANCHHRLEDPATAEKFYKMFLDSNWEPEKYGKEVAYAKEYQRRIGFSVSEKGQAYQEKQSCQITRSGRESCSVGARIGRISIDVNNPEGKAGWEDEYVIELKPTGDINKEFGVDWNRPHSVGSISTSKPDFISILPKFRYQMQQYLILRLGDAENNQIAGVMDFMKPDQKYPPFDLYLDRDRDGDLA